MTYTMTVREAFRPGGASFDVATAEAGGKIYEAKSRSGATMRLARQMVADGLPDGAWQAVGPQGQVRYGGPSLHRLARLTVSDPDSGKGGLRIVPHKEWTGGGASTTESAEALADCTA